MPTNRRLTGVRGWYRAVLHEPGQRQNEEGTWINTIVLKSVVTEDGDYVDDHLWVDARFIPRNIPWGMTIEFYAEQYRYLKGRKKERFGLTAIKNVKVLYAKSA